MATWADVKPWIARRWYDATQTVDAAVQLAAANRALLRLCLAHDWNYYQGTFRLTLVASYSTGTVAVAAAGTAVTLTTGTWPSWSADGHIRIASNSLDNEVASLGTGPTAAVITLESDEAWQGTVQTAATYEIYRIENTLPTDFLRMTELYLNSTASEIEYINWRNFENYRRDYYLSSGVPVVWTLRGTKLFLWPSTEADTVSAGYIRKPTILVDDTTTLDVPVELEPLFYAAVDVEMAEALNKPTAVTAKEPTFQRKLEDAKVFEHKRIAPIRRAIPPLLDSGGVGGYRSSEESYGDYT